MKSKIIAFIKTYSLNILLVIGFVGVFVLTQFIHNVHVYKWLFIEYLTGYGYEGEVNSNNKIPLQKFLFTLPLIGCSVLVDYFRSLFYPEENWKRLYVACVTLFAIFIINWIIFELFGSVEYQSLYSPENMSNSDEYIPFHPVNILLIIDLILSSILIVGVLILEKLAFIQSFNRYIKNILLKFGDTNQA